MSEDLRFPPALAALVEIDFHEANEIDLEMFDEFSSAAETTDWLRAWTGNDDADGAEFRPFGQDGTGGMAALWLVRPEVALDGQPVVFVGSEGEAGVVARDLADLLWLLADGLGPAEVVEQRGAEPATATELRDIAERLAPGRERPSADLVAAARDEFPGFTERIDSLCRY